MSVIGIDFGNADCYIAQVKGGGIDLILNENSNRKNPCLVSFQGKERFVGEVASSMARSNYKNTVTSIKRLIGRNFAEPEVQTEISKLAYNTRELEDGTVGIEVTYNDEIKVFSCEQIFAMMLSKLKAIVEENNPGYFTSDVVLSVPGWFNNYQRSAILNAVEIAGLNCLRLMNDHAATALSYGIYKSARDMFHTTDPQYVMFVDLGHSSYTVSIVAFVQGKLQVKAACHDRNLGGRDFDEVVARYFAKDFETKTGYDPLKNPKAVIKLIAGAEKAKKNISPQGVTETNCNVECLMNDQDYFGKMTLEQFESACAPLVEKLKLPVSDCLAQAGLTPQQLQCCELVGGGTRVQCVKRLLAELLSTDQTKTNFGLNTTLNADESVARGCALQCAILSPLFKVKPFNIIDIVPYAIRLSWEQTSTEAVDARDDAEESPIEGKNSIIIMKKFDETPKTRRVTFRRTDAFEVVAQYDEVAIAALPEGTPQELGRFKINVPPPPEGEDIPRIRVNVRHNVHGIFGVSSAHLMEEIKEEAPADEKEGEAESESKPVDSKAASKQEEGNSEDQANYQEAGSESKAGEDESPEHKQVSEPMAEQQTTKKKRYKKIDLQLESFKSGMTRAQLTDAIDEEGKMAQQDRLIRETADKRNELETYIYKVRSDLDGGLANFISEQSKTDLKTLLSEAEEWLYSDEGFDTTKSVYQQKLNDLVVLGDKPGIRKQEANARPQATSDFLSIVEHYRSIANSESYGDLTSAEKQSIKDECEAAERWLHDQLAVQNELPNDQDPVLTVSMIQDKRQTTIDICNPLATKVKKKESKEDSRQQGGGTEEAKQEEGKEDEETVAEEKLDLD